MCALYNRDMMNVVRTWDNRGTSDSTIGNDEEFLLQGSDSVDFDPAYTQTCEEYRRGPQVSRVRSEIPRIYGRSSRDARNDNTSYDYERAQRLEYLDTMRPLALRELRNRETIKQTNWAPIGDFGGWLDREYDVTHCEVRRSNKGGAGERYKTDLENMYNTIPLVSPWQNPNYHMGLDTNDYSSASRIQERKRAERYMTRSVV